MVVQTQLPGPLEAVPAGLADPGTPPGMLVIGRDIADALVEPILRGLVPESEG